MGIERKRLQHSIKKPDWFFRSSVRLVLLAFAYLLLTGCAVQRSASEKNVSSTPDIIVLGAVAKTGLKLPLDTARMSIDLAALLAGRGDIKVTSAVSARRLIGAGPHDEMMAFYAKNGRLAPHQTQRLMAANLPSSRALIVRLVSDQVEQLPMEREVVLDEQAQPARNQERLTYATQRTTRLGAALVDLGNGRVVWTRQYGVNSLAKLGSVHKTGNSLGGSIAATVANTFFQSISEARYPAPPALYDSALALLQEVAYQVPLE